MAQEYLDIGSSPAMADCAQVGQPDFEERAQRECHRLIRTLKHMHGDPPTSVRFKVQRNHHDFGDYFSVVVWYDDESEEAAAYALACEDLPEDWLEEVA